MINNSETKKFSGMRKARLKQQQATRRNSCQQYRDSVERAVYGNHMTKDAQRPSSIHRDIRTLEIKRATLLVRIRAIIKEYKPRKGNDIEAEILRMLIEIDKLDFQMSNYGK